MKLLRNFIAGNKLLKTIRKYRKHLNPILKAREEGDFSKEKKLIVDSTKLWVDDTLKSIDVRVHVNGRDNIPEEPFVVISNHQGYFDILAIMKAIEGHQVGFIAKESLKKVPYLGTWIVAIRGVFIEKNNAREAVKAIRNGINNLREGFSMAIFPEGTRSQNETIGRFKPGSFKLATKEKFTILPMAINGTYKVFEEKEAITGNQDVYIDILPPVCLKNMDKEELSNVHVQVEHMIRDDFEKLRQSLKS